jgi:hypothetical protein
MFVNDFNRTIDIWINELKKYDFVQLCSKPSADSWSIGQVYMHLIENTEYYIEQIKTCISTNDNIDGEATTNGKAMLSNNDFPDELLEGPPENLNTPQPVSKDEIMQKFIALKNEMNALGSLIEKAAFHGKTRHPGLDYFNAREWLQFAEMHLRHHFRQKKRIDDFLVK